MKIITQQWYERKNLLSYKTRVEAERLPQLISYVEENISSIGLNISGDIIFFAERETAETDTSILGVELLIPVDRKFTSTCRYVFKPVFRIENAVMAKVRGGFGMLWEAHREIRKILFSGGMCPLTKTYFVVERSRCDTDSFKLLVGIDGNSA